MPARPHAILIAGPNGAGKTTFAREYLPGEPDGVRFLNADLIAAGPCHRSTPTGPRSARGGSCSRSSTRR